ncbi:MAG: XRE family transcriptional regulator [Bacteroidales bacterium]|nr:XRE family transcriptional regulator [Bacteroidales bacterium]
MKRIGERINAKRKQLNLQLNDLAKKVGISPSALSQIEKAKAFPSIITLKSIAENLYTTVGELIGENETLSKNPVMQRNEMKFVERNSSGTEIFLITHHDLNKQMDTYFVRFIQGSDLVDLFTANSGQIFCYVVSGEISFNLDAKDYLLHVGDSIYFNSKTTYSAINNSDSICELLWIISG